MPFNLLVLACLAYVVMLFCVAFVGERRAREGNPGWLRAPVVYTLSLSIYCTAWTFYGAVGYASRSGLEFLTIYFGPTLVFVGWWWVLRKLVRIGRQQRVTSIADLISSRFGKSTGLAALVTVMAVVATTPYIALQLQSVVQSFGVFASSTPDGLSPKNSETMALWVAAGLTIFTILFGTRAVDANEQHHGIVAAIALEAVVKLVALIAVGVFVVWGIGGGPEAMATRIAETPLPELSASPGHWMGLIVLSAAAVICLPRMFQVLVVENVNERHLATASWAFPLYLFMMSLFIVPIAVMGMERLPAGSNPDMFVLTLPLSEGQGALALLAFLGGFSSATAMVIVEAIALATMVSNHVVLPLWLRFRPQAAVTGDLRQLVLMARRVSIGAILLMAYLYYRASGGSASLASIGLIAFVGVAQFLPAILGGLFWRGATRNGAAWGLGVGFVVWAYSLYLPILGSDAGMTVDVMSNGPLGIEGLRPHALFGVVGMDPVLHATFWSLALNAAAFFLGSVLSFPGPVERLQGAVFVNAFEGAVGPKGWRQGGAEPEALLVLTQRVLGDEAAQAFFQRETEAQGKAGLLPDPTPEFVAALERMLAGSVGAGTAHAMISQQMGRETVSVEELMAVANETAQILEYSVELEAQKAELARAARALGEANEKLTRLSAQKDAFLSQISHELRTPMTSIRAFSEILTDPDLAPADVGRFAGVIQEEALRLTRLLDDLLDLSVLESGAVQLQVKLTNLREIIDRALQVAGTTRPERSFLIQRDMMAEAIHLRTDPDRLTQVLINLISNARKYCDAAEPELRISVRTRAGRVMIDVIDNGRGIPKESQSLIFEKFARLADEARAGGAGLGLAICREVVTSLGGTIGYLPGQGGAAFRVTLPLRLEQKAA